MSVSWAQAFEDEDEYEYWDDDEFDSSDPDWALDLVWDGPDCGKYMVVNHYAGVVWRITGHNVEQYKGHMVGDNREETFDIVDIQLLDEDEKVCSCGQRGCGWDC